MCCPTIFTLEAKNPYFFCVVVFRVSSMPFELTLSTTGRTDEHKKNFPVDIKDAKEVVFVIHIDYDYDCGGSGEHSARGANLQSLLSLAPLSFLRSFSHNNLGNLSLLCNRTAGLYIT